jgi:2-keto-3-deoxy-L-fuconate dehydrogenase
MTGRLSGKRALLTAAGQGIGCATALAFLREGADVLATDRDEKLLATLLAGNSAMRTAVLDVRDKDRLDAIVATAGPIDVLFNCAGIVQDGAILDCGEDDWTLAFDLNVTPIYRICRLVLPGMIERRSGSIVNVASVASSLKGVPRRFAYGTTKAAVIGLTKAIAADHVGHGVRCNAICPGTIETPSLQGRIEAQAAAAGSLDQARSNFVARQPMGRLGRAEEIASLAVYLASDEAAFTTGQCHVIDGGWLN